MAIYVAVWIAHKAGLQIATRSDKGQGSVSDRHAFLVSSGLLHPFRLPSAFRP